MKRSPGRPPLDEDDESVPVCVTLPRKQFDYFTRRAFREDKSVPEIIRRELNKNLKTQQRES